MSKFWYGKNMDGDIDGIYVGLVRRMHEGFAVDKDGNQTGDKNVMIGYAVGDEMHYMFVLDPDRTVISEIRALMEED